MHDKTYILTARGSVDFAAVSEEAERAVSHMGDRAKIAYRLPWGVVVRSDASLPRLIEQVFPRLQVEEDKFADLAQSR